MQGPIWIKTIECWGNESSLAACPGAVWEHNYYCKHSEDVGLECLLTQHSDTGSQGGGEVGGYVDIMMFTDISALGHSIKLRLGAVRQGGGGAQAGAAGGQGGGRPDCSARVTAMDCQHQGARQLEELPLVRRGPCWPPAPPHRCSLCGRLP